MQDPLQILMEPNKFSGDILGSSAIVGTKVPSPPPLTKN